MNWDQDRYIEALNFASDAHRGQLVPGSQRPYDIHLAKVAMEVIAALAHTHTANGDFAVQCALLHDCLEDTAVTAAVLSAAFGSAVAAGVQALTKDDTLPKAQKMADSLTRILQQPKEIALVKLADRITNMAQPPDHWPNDKRIAYRREAEVILQQIGHANDYLAARLAAKIDAYSAWID
jgi:(p)ppGpp synthase/HD superfamily hydrolase